MAAPEFAVVDVRRAFLLPLTKGAQAGVPLVEDKLNKTHSLSMKRRNLKYMKNPEIDKFDRSAE